ncbi:RHS repeat domain-containing protein [Cohnella faecalis]|uniref:RHS repeat domain-containing protein n=1 Tax=Cohnella faecalis TaxID=2315694 RepID=UPI001314CDC1|nr:RHS repeat domain-containing protein [Cohnella faecalis]
MFSQDSNGQKRKAISSEDVYFKDKTLKTLKNYQGATLLDTYDYIYDPAGNQLKKTERVNGANKGETNYQYDDLNRLKQVTEPSGKMTDYTFDAFGNRSSERTTQGAAVTVLNYSYNEQNRLIATAEVKSTGDLQQVMFTYDNNGNMIAKSSEITKKIDPANVPTPTFGIFIYGQVNQNTRIALQVRWI